MKTQSRFMDTVKSSYLVLVIAALVNAVKASYTITIMGVLGVFAFISAVLIAWPALAYLGAKMFN